MSLLISMNRAGRVTELVLSAAFASAFSPGLGHWGLPALAMHAANNDRSNIFVITNRKRAGDASSRIDSFSYKRANGITYCAGPGLSHFSPENFYQKLSNLKAKSIIVFVHGYNCNLNISYSMANKIRETTGLPVVMFAWPSKRNPFTYTTDECNAEWSSFQLADILHELNKRYGNQNIILVGHSMGCRILCWALQHQAAGLGTSTFTNTFTRSEASGGQEPETKFQHIFLCAPDMDSQVFEKNVPLLVKSADDTTVFASRKDIRLFFSKVLHGNTRLGLLKKASYEDNSERSIGMVNVVDYTSNDRTIFGHAVPYELLKRCIDRGR